MGGAGRALRCGDGADSRGAVQRDAMLAVDGNHAECSVRMAGGIMHGLN